MTGKRTNVLVTSAGRRVGLIRAFQEAVRPRGGRVITTDASPELSAACQFADDFRQVPRIDATDYVDATLKAARDWGVGLIVPTLDTELLALARSRELFLEEGIGVSIPDLSFVEQCRDKRKTAQLFAELGIEPLREVTDEFPRFVKPVAGSLSQDTHIVRTFSELDDRLKDATKFVHQELVDPAVYAEYTVDALYSIDGRLVGAVPRRRLEVRGGEISKGRTDKGLLLDLVRSKLGYIPGARGCLTIQFFNSETAIERPTIGIEINPRFGGGYPMSHSAGAGFPGRLIEEALDGAPLVYEEDWVDGATFLRFDEHVSPTNF